MIDWQRVESYFRLYLSEFGEENTLKDYLKILYEDLKLSWRQIAGITDGYASDICLANKAKSLGVVSRERGGPRRKLNTILLGMDLLEYQALTIEALAKKYKVHRSTIFKYARILGLPKKEPGRPKERGEPQSEVDGTYQ